jgi:oligopeptide transport system substrate-binding protein
MQIRFFSYGLCSLSVLTFLHLSACRNTVSDKKIFRFNQVQNVESLDPAFAKNLNIMWHVQQCYNRLIEYDAHMNPQPSLAKSWAISSDRKTYTFLLRNDVFFHDNDAFPGGVGRRMTAHDVVYSFHRIIDPKVASPGAWIFNDRVDSLKPFEAIDDTTFVMHLTRPFNPMLGIVSMMYCSVVPHEVVEKWGADFRAHPCGTGPFVFENWEESVAITYRKNKRYWETDSSGVRLPYIDGLKCLQVDSKATEFLLFLQGDIDFMNGIDAVFKDQLLTKKGMLQDAYTKRFRMQTFPYLNVEYLGILVDSQQTSSKPLLQKKLRQAINYGFDRQKLVTYIRNNIGIPANAGIIPIGLSGYDSNAVHGYSYQPDKARQMVNEIQMQTGTLPAITLLTNDNYADRCTFIASQLKDVGLDVRIEIMQPSLLREQMSNSRADFFWATWIADYPDAECYLAMFYSKHAAPPNYTRFANQEYDLLYEQCLIAESEAEKIALYQQMDRILIEEAPFVPLFYDEVLHFIQNRVTHFSTNSLNLIDLKRVKLD